MATYTTTSQPLPYQVPYLQDYWSRAQDVANVPYQQSPGTYVGPNQMLQQGWQATAQRALQGSPTMGAANTQLQNTINGQYLNSNPYLNDQITAAQGDLVNSWNLVNKPSWDKTMQNSGSMGNTGVAQYAQNDMSNLQRNLGRVASDMRMQGYNTERGYQQQALGMAPGYAQNDYMDANALLNAGSQAQTFNQNAQNQNQQWWQEAQQYPVNRLNVLGQALGIGGGTQSTQTQPDPSVASQVIGGGLTGISLYNLLFGGK